MAAAAVTGLQPAKPLGPNLVGTVASVSVDRLGVLLGCTVTNLPGVDDMTIPGADCSRLFAAEVNELGAGIGGIVGMRVKVSVTPGNQFYIDYTLGG